MFDDLRSNATLTAMLAYLASEESATITRERVDLVALAEAAKSDTSANRRPVPTSWPECVAAPRVTKPRLK